MARKLPGRKRDTGASAVTRWANAWCVKCNKMTQACFSGQCPWKRLECGGCGRATDIYSESPVQLKGTFLGRPYVRKDNPDRI